ncbi:hypothetical protein EV368DRAFT_86341 [Lentinula lateritia]|nr:hypothetical protein EV368DRAFT_86341 [Lentinula lateritia]
MDEDSTCARCAMAAWISSVLFLIPAVQVRIGQASFLLLIAAFLSPPIDPFLAVLKREVLISLFVAATWAFACPMHTALFSNGQYVQAAPSAILAIFIFIGTAILLYIRVHQGPGPYLLTALFSSLTVLRPQSSHLYPFGVSLHHIHLGASVILFPETLSNNFTKRVAAVLAPLQKATSIHLILLQSTQSQAVLGPLAQAARLLPSEVVYSRYSPTDRRPLQDPARRVAVRANGMLIYFTLIDPTRERSPVTPAMRRPGSPVGTSPSTPVERHSEPPHHHHLSNLLHRAHLHNSSRFHHRVSLSYGNRHTSHAPGVWCHTTQTYKFLQESCTPLLEQRRSATVCLQSWFAGVASRDGAFWRLARGIISSTLLSTAAETERREKAKQLQWEKRVSEIRCIHEKLEEVLLDSPVGTEDSNNWNHEYNQLPSHRYLFNCYVYQYHLMQFANMLGELFDPVIRWETRPERRHQRTKSVWTDNDNVCRSASAGAEGEEGEEEDPDRVHHVDRDRGSDIEFDELSGGTRVGNRVLNDEEDNMYGMGLP